MRTVNTVNPASRRMPRNEWRKSCIRSLIQRAIQVERLPEATWHDAMDTVPQQPLLVLANEFLDALPIRQFVRRNGAWMERFVSERRLVEVPATSPPPAPLPQGEGEGCRPLSSPHGLQLVDEAGDHIQALLPERRIRRIQSEWRQQFLMPLSAAST